MLDPYEIADICQDLSGKQNITAINKLYRKQDESHLWPICSQFNVTERAIKRAREYRKEYPIEGLEYSLLLDNIMSEIVNDPNNY